MKRVFVVLGMHRGGTSAVARSLIVMGVPLGDVMLPSRPDNPTGFWEDREIVDLNDRVLAAFGLHWHSLAPIPRSAFLSRELDELKAEGRKLLAGRLMTTQVWGFKDPRTSRLLDFWEPLFRDLDLSAAPIIALRNPLSVAASLRRRDGFEAEKCYLLWALHMMPLLRLAQSPGAVVVDYDTLLAAPEAELARMAERLDLAPPAPQAIAAYASEFLDAGLRHSHFDSADLKVEPRLIEAVAWAYDLLVRSGRDLRIESDEIRQVVSSFEALSPLLDYAHVLESAVAAQAGRIAGLELDASAARERLAQKDSELIDLQAERVVHAKVLMEGTARMAVLHAEQGEMRRALAELTGESVGLKKDRSSLQETIAEVANRLSALDATVSPRLADLDHHLAKLEQKADLDQGQLSRLTERFSGLASDQAAFRAQADCHDAELLSLLNPRPGRLARLAGRLALWARPPARKLRRVRDLAANFVFAAREQGVDAALRRAAAFIGRRVAIPRPAATREPPRVPASVLDHLERPASLGEIRARGPMISVLMPVFNTPPDILEDTVQSVLRQTYPNWELCICDDCSSNPSTLEVLQRYQGSDWRIKIVRSQTSLHIARATNLAAELATGEFVGFLDHDDLLEVDALEYVAQAITGEPEVDFIYTDEDKLELDGQLTEPYLKPDWSPEHLQSVMYILHFMVVRKKLFLELGGLRHAFTGSQDYDLALRATAKARKVVHIPRILYHWRKVPGSAAAVVDAKPQALRNAKLALQDFVTSKDPGGGVEDGLLPGTYRVKWSLEPAEPVTLVVLTGARYRDVEGRGKLLLVDNFVDSIISKSTYPRYHLLVVDDNANLPPHVRQKVERAGGSVVSFPLTQRKFNFSEKANFALSQVQTENVILLNDDLEVITGDWIEALLAFSRRSEIGAVGAKLLFPNGRIQHAGVVLGINGPAAHVFHNMSTESVGYCGYTHLVRNYSAVTGAVIATRMSLVRKVGCFDEALAVDFNDIDFCLRLRAAGYRIVYTPYARLYHFEGSSLQRRIQNASERAEFLERWRPLVERDPYYHPRLPRDRLDCVFT